VDPFTNCARKRSFPSREAARAAASSARAGGVKGLKTFKCRVCGSFHNGRRGGRRNSR
jgi:hypothetical protein